MCIRDRSLCVEEHFYLMFPLLAWALMRRPSVVKFGAVCVLVVLAGIALRSGVWLHNNALDQAGAQTRPSWFVEDIYYPTWNRLDGLLFGVVLAVLRTFRPLLWPVSYTHLDVYKRQVLNVVKPALPISPRISLISSNNASGDSDCCTRMPSSFSARKQDS